MTTDIRRRAVLHPPPPESSVTVIERTYGGGNGDVLPFDVYRPAEQSAHRLPAVVIVSGYPDAGFEKIVGCRFKDMASTVSWARLFAANGVAAIAYANREPAGDLFALLRALQSEPSIGPPAIGLFATSGNVPVALSALMTGSPVNVACAAFACGYMLDRDGNSVVGDAARTFRFANPCQMRRVHDLRRDVPMLIARAGRDEMPGLNESIDAFLADALTANLPVTCINHPDAPHAFDLFHESERTIDVIRQILGFTRRNLTRTAE